MPDPVVPVYFDSTLVAKFYVNEAGRNEVRALARSSGVVVTSGIAIAEVSAAFHRKYRERAVDARTLKALLGQFTQDVADGLWTFVGPSEVLLQRVQRVFLSLDRSIFLRSLDALHVVTARDEGFDRLYSNDRHMLAACASLGIKGIDPTVKR